MKRSTFFQALVGFILHPGLFIIKAQPDMEEPPKWRPPELDWEKYVTKSQKKFAVKCIRFGEAMRIKRGHTLASLAWNESWLGSDLNHDEDSYGPFGMSIGMADHIRKRLRRDPDEGDLEDFDNDTVKLLLQSDFEYAAKMTIWLFNWHMQNFLNAGFSRGAAWKYASQAYAAWRKWKTRPEYGNAFAARVKFLKTIKIGESHGDSDERG